MAPLPHDVTDLRLAPVILRVDRHLETFTGLHDDEVQQRLARPDNPPVNREQRQQALLDAIGEVVDLHGWDGDWTGRGLRLCHGDSQVTLGLPAGLVRYLDGS